MNSLQFSDTENRIKLVKNEFLWRFFMLKYSTFIFTTFQSQVYGLCNGIYI